MSDKIRKASHDGVPPLIDGNCTTLLLGSILSPKSQEQSFYYAHPQNRFWRVLASVFGCEDGDRRAREALALSHRVALWDVLRSCDIVGASDSTIRNETYNDIAGLLDEYPRITRIFATGSKAFSLLNKYNKPIGNPVIASAVRLPSTSPLNCKTGLSALIEAYSVIIE